MTSYVLPQRNPIDLEPRSAFGSVHQDTTHAKRVILSLRVNSARLKAQEVVQDTGNSVDAAAQAFFHERPIFSGKKRRYQPPSRTTTNV